MVSAPGSCYLSPEGQGLRTFPGVVATGGGGRRTPAHIGGGLGPATPLQAPPRPPPPPPGPPQATATAVAPSPARKLPSLLPHRPPPPPPPPSRCVTALCVTAPDPAPTGPPRVGISRRHCDEQRARQRAARAARRAGGECGGRRGPGGEGSDGGWTRPGGPPPAPCDWSVRGLTGRRPSGRGRGGARAALPQATGR